MKYTPIILILPALIGGAALGASGVYLALDRPPAPAAMPAAEVVAPPSAPAPAQQDDAQRALEGVQKRAFLSLQAIGEAVRARFPGEIIGAKLTDDDGVVEYELKVLTSDGRILEITADAKSGVILDVEEDD